MKLLSWNCQGLGNPLTVQSLKALVAKERLDIIFLMETKNQEVVVKRLQKRLKYPSSFCMYLCISGLNDLASRCHNLMNGLHLTVIIWHFLSEVTQALSNASIQLPISGNVRVRYKSH